MDGKRLPDSDGKFKTGLDHAGIRRRFARTVLGGRHLHPTRGPLDPRLRVSLHALADPAGVDPYLPDLDRHFPTPLLRGDRRRELAAAGHDVPARLDPGQRRAALAEAATYAAQMVDRSPVDVANNAAARVVAGVERERSRSADPLSGHAGEDESDSDAAARLAGAGQHLRIEARAAIAHLHGGSGPKQRALFTAMETSIREHGRVVDTFVADRIGVSPRTVERRRRALTGG